MQTVVSEMLQYYKTNSLEDKKNAIKEIVQEITLCGLSRTGFFKKVAFYGGTALRIFYGLDRFSEDLDFSLINTDREFKFSDYFAGVEKELASVGLKFDIEEKRKSFDSNIKSAFLKGNTKEHILNIYGLKDVDINPEEKIKIKIEIDTSPPDGATFEDKFRLLPTPYEVKLYDKRSLFAGKIHAVLCRSWHNRIKGRDLYDYVFYLANKSSVNLHHLRARLEDSGVLNKCDVFTIETLKEMLRERFESINYEEAKKDVFPFISNKNKVELWNAKFFLDITAHRQMLCNFYLLK